MLRREVRHAGEGQCVVAGEVALHGRGRPARYVAAEDARGPQQGSFDGARSSPHPVGGVGGRAQPLGALVPAALQAQAPRETDAHVLVPGARVDVGQRVGLVEQRLREVVHAQRHERAGREATGALHVLAVLRDGGGVVDEDGLLEMRQRRRHRRQGTVVVGVEHGAARQQHVRVGGEERQPVLGHQGEQLVDQLVERGAGGGVPGVGGEDDARDQCLAQQERPQARVARAGGRRAQDGLERGKAALRVGTRDTGGREGGGAGAADELGPRGHAGGRARCARRASREHRHLRRPGTPVGSPDSDDRAKGRAERWTQRRSSGVTLLRAGEAPVPTPVMRHPRSPWRARPRGRRGRSPTATHP